MTAATRRPEASRVFALAGALMAFALAGCAARSEHEFDLRRNVAPPAPATAALTPAKGYQWLHGSGEAAVLSASAYSAMTRHVEAELAARQQGRALGSVVLAPGATPAAPRWEPCEAKPPAVVFDIDETAILNSGANYDAARRGDPGFDAARWAGWERDGAAFVQPVPGAAEALAQLRAAGVTPIFVSNRESVNAAGAAAALDAAGLGPAVHNRTLFLRGDVAPGSGKDPRRQAVAAQWCVLAMMGDQLGDFSDAFNSTTLSVQDRRALAQSPGVAAKWGVGWFLLPNPLYGPGVAGTLDDIFPANTRWPGPSETR